MKEQELSEKITAIRKGKRLLDSMLNRDWETGEAKLTKVQANMVQDVIDLLDSLNWAVKFSSYKELQYDKFPALDQRGCGKPVKVRSCKDGHGTKTYFGILIGDMALSIGHNIKDGVVTARHSGHNPAIFVPELGEVIYGCESWWGEIESEEEMDKLITDETISNVWYVKMLKEGIGSVPTVNALNKAGE